MKAYTFYITGSDFHGWVFSDTPENAKIVVQKLYYEDMRENADCDIALHEVDDNAIAFGTYPFESGYCCREYFSE
jgi:hypothetical protein